MKIIKRLALGAVTAASGVLIACAYGMSYAWRGQVTDRSTNQPVPGIQVECEDGGQGVATTYTDASGYYEISDNFNCDRLVFTDVDGADNGAYDATQIDSPSLETNDNDVALAPVD